MKYLIIIFAVLVSFCAIAQENTDVPADVKSATETPAEAQPEAVQPEPEKLPVMEVKPAVAVEKVKPQDDNAKKEAARIAQENKKRLDEIEERLDTVEKKTLVDRLNLSMDVRMTLNNYIYRDNSSEATKNLGLLNGSGETFGAWNMRGRLKMNSMLGDSFKLTVWLTMYKQFIESAPGRYENQMLSPNYDIAKSSYPGNSSVYMERLFLDWFITDWLSFSIGRAPTVDGTPAELRYNSVPFSSFFESELSAPLDGLYFTFNLKRFTGLDLSCLRVFYAPQLFMDTVIPNNLFVQSGLGISTIAGVMWQNSLPFTEGGQFILEFATQPELKAGDIKNDINGDGKAEDLFVGNSLAFFYRFYTGFVMPRFFGLPIDIFITGSVENFTTPARTGSNINDGFIGLPISNGISVPVLTLFGNDLSGKNYTSGQIYAGIRYNTPLELFNDNLKIGADINYSTKYFFMYFVPDTTGLSRFAVKGINAEAYVIIPIHRKANIRLGYIYQHHDYPFDFVYPVGQGTPSIDETIHNFNVMLNVYF